MDAPAKDFFHVFDLAADLSKKGKYEAAIPRVAEGGRTDGAISRPRSSRTLEKALAADPGSIRLGYTLARTLLVQNNQDLAQALRNSIVLHEGSGRSRSRRA
jgi:hypothetical protein